MLIFKIVAAVLHDIPVLDICIICIMYNILNNIHHNMKFLFIQKIMFHHYFRQYFYGRISVPCILEEQSDFRKGRGFMNQVFAVRLVCEKYVANGKEV